MLHLLACDQPWGYDAIASSNAGDTEQVTYTIPNTLDANVAAAWADSFRTVSASAGTPADAIVHDNRFAVTTLPAFAGPDVHVYSVEDAIADANAETGTAIGADGVTMDVVQSEAGDATPTNLRCAIEAGSHRPAIVQWSRSQPPSTPRSLLPPSLPFGSTPAATRVRLRSLSPRHRPHVSTASPIRLRA